MPLAQVSGHRRAEGGEPPDGLPEVRPARLANWVRAIMWIAWFMRRLPRVVAAISATAPNISGRCPVTHREDGIW